MKKLLLLTALLLVPSMALADSPRHVINESDTTSTIDCGEGGEVVLNGAENTLTVTGACAKVVVNGSSNTVTLDGTDKIAVNGSDNTVTWKRGWKKKAPKIARLGTGNSVKRAK